MFRRATGGTIVHRAFAGTWSAPHTIGGAVEGTSAAASRGKGRIDVFILTATHRLLQRTGVS
jgi:hypothetical protein